jgi:hypothetical protein
MVAAIVFDEFHVTESVMSVVSPFCKIPVAVNCAVSPDEIDVVVEVISIETRLDDATVTVVEPLTPSKVALIVAEPAAMPVTRPVELTVAMLVSDDDHETESVTVLVAPSSYVPVAIICCVLPTATVGVEGVTVTVVREGGIKKFLQPAIANTPRANAT